MILNDNFPERRNLTAISMAIIVYYWGGAKLTSSTLKLPLINVEFANPQVLYFLVWVVFGWVWYRFWLVTKNINTHNSIKEKIKMEMKRYPVDKKHHPFFEKEMSTFLKKQQSKVTEVKVDYDPQESKDRSQFLVSYVKNDGTGPTGPEKLEVGECLTKRGILNDTIAKAAFKEPNTNAYYTTKFLGWVAFFTLIWNIPWIQFAHCILKFLP